MCIYYVSCVFTSSGCGVFDCVIQCARCNLEFACLSTSPLSLCVFVRMYKCVFDSDAMMPGTGRREARHSSHSYDATVTLDQSGRQRHTAVGMTLHFCSGGIWDGIERGRGGRMLLASALFWLYMLLKPCRWWSSSCQPELQQFCWPFLPSFFLKKLSKVCKKLPNQNFVRLKSNFNDI